MSDFSSDDELVLEYLAESREHLATIETDLLQIEQGGADIDEQLVNRVFRAAHSIKGGAGFFDLGQIKELAHRTENVLDLVRSRQIVPDSEIVSILLLSFDKLNSLLLDYQQSNLADISEFTAALSRVAQEHLSPRRKSSTERVVEIASPDSRVRFAVKAFNLDQARLQGNRLYAIEIDLIHDVHRLGRTPLQMLNDLMSCGVVLDSEFDLESAGTLDDEPSKALLLHVLYASELDAQTVAETAALRARQVRAIDAANGEPTEPGVATPSMGAAEAEPAVVPPPVSIPAEAAPRGEPKAKAAAMPAAAPSANETTIRLNVALLDSLMTLAGELVLGRNQLNEAVSKGDQQGIRSGAHRVSLVTSELQEAVALTRMRPVSTVFAKFPRLVRDLAGDLGKDVQLVLEGGEVELDKTILEGLSDPLTHMVRNSVDHGIEGPAERAGAGKPAKGTVALRAKHQAGQVVIEISDDGKGLSGEKISASAVKKGLIAAEQLQGMSERDKQALLFLPGVSTAEKLSDVSGRGVGMDVVKTNLDKLGGKIEIESVEGSGSTFRIKLPLTLAIIPSLLVSSSGQRFAIPQVSVGELVRIPSHQIAERITRAGEAEVVLLRDRLVPLVRLADALGSGSGERGDRAMSVVLVNAGTFEYGLVVDELHDTVEIVVKPMGRHMQKLREYAGATILGDGQVAVILDVTGLAQRAGLLRGSASIAAAAQAGAEADDKQRDFHSLLLFHNSPGEQCAAPIELVTRVERISRDQVEMFGGRRTMQHDGASLPLVTIHDVAAAELSDTQQWAVVVFERGDRPVGLLVAEPLDMVEAAFDLDQVTLRQTGVAGSAIINGKTTMILDLFELAGKVTRKSPETERRVEQHTDAGNATVLVAEDSDFFRGQITRLIEAVGYKVLAAEDGESAWELLDQHPGEVTVVTTDVEMPRLDGLGLTRRIRSDSRFAQLPVIALSTLAGEEDIARGLALGVSEYQVKLDQNQLLESIRRAVNGAELTRSPAVA